MDDFLSNIKKTEADAEKIIKDADNKAKEIVEKAYLESHKTIQEQKTGIIKKYEKKKKNEFEKIIKEKETQINLKSDQFITDLENIEEKRKQAVKHIKTIIKSF